MYTYIHKYIYIYIYTDTRMYVDQGQNTKKIM